MFTQTELNLLLVFSFVMIFILSTWHPKRKGKYCPQCGHRVKKKDDI